ncbi:MAG: FHA domain-containing protein [Phycisphaeraceae bacterium JB051]
MASLQILLLSGPRQGQRLELTGEEFLFGRQLDCDIPISGDFVSREHGMIAMVNGQWILQNASPNGTQVNRKKVGRKGFKLLTQDIVQVGGEDVFQVIVPDVAAATTVTQPEDAPDDSAGRAASKRSKIWIGIGVYMVFMMFLFIYLGTLGKSEDQEIEKPRELTRTQIETIIRKPADVTAPDPLAAAEFLSQADELYNRQDATYSGTYRVYHAYKMALAHSRKKYFDDKHQLRFEQVQNQLIQEVSHRYNEAFERLRSREYKAAEQRFRRLNDYYPDTTTEIFKNCEKQRRYILLMIKKYKR